MTHNLLLNNNNNVRDINLIKFTFTYFDFPKQL